MIGIRTEILKVFERRFKDKHKEIPFFEGLEFVQISAEEKISLEQEFTREDIRIVVLESDGEKSLGHNGVNFTLIQDCWNFFEEDIGKFVKEFYHSVILPKSITVSFVALILKNHNPRVLNEYRPIFFVGCYYKILAKRLENRIKRVLNGLILSTQTAFVPGRQILDGVLAFN